MRIAMIGTRGLPSSHGGVEKAVEALARRLAEKGHELTVYGRRGYCSGDSTPFQGVRQIALPCVRTKHLEAVSHTVLAALHATAHRQYDVIHFHATGPAMFATIPKVRGIPTVATVHGLDWKREKWGVGATAVLRVAARLSVTVPTRTIVVSRELQRILRSEYSAETTFIPNGVDVSELQKTSPVEGLESGRFVLFLGRLVPEKQIHVLIEAFASVRGDQKLVIAGPTAHSDAYVERLKLMASDDTRIHFIGPRYGAEKNWLFRNARVFVQPSSLEGHPIALLEAFACGAQAIVSDIPENLEASRLDGQLSARVFRMGNVADLAAALEEFLRSEERLLPDMSARVAELSDWDWIAEQTESVYRLAVGESVPVGRVTTSG